MSPLPMTKTATLPTPEPALFRRAVKQFDPTRLPKRTSDIVPGKTYEAALTEETCKALPFPERGRYYVKWAGKRGLTLHVTRDCMTLYGRTRGASSGGWQRIGELDELFARYGTFPQIALNAGALLDQVALGNANPTADARRARDVRRANETTVAEAVDAFLAEPTKHGAARAASTVAGVRGSIRRFCADAWEGPVAALSDARTLAMLYAARVAVARHDAHRALTELGNMANAIPAYRGIRNAIADARGEYRLSRGDMSSRECGYDERDLPKIAAHWLDVATHGKHASDRTCGLRMYVSLFTMLRVSCLSALRWEMLRPDDMGGGMFRVPAHLFKQTQYTRRKKVIDVPVPSRLYALLMKLRPSATSPYLFPSATDPNKPMGLPTPEFLARHGLPAKWAKPGAMAYCGVHDARRLAAKTVAERLPGRDWALKGLLTHSHLSGSITERYKGEPPYRPVRALSEDYEALFHP